MVLYELLTRHKPFAGDNMTKVTHRIVYEPFTPMSDFVADLPPGLEAIVSRALEKNPDDRFQSAAEFGRALKAVRDEAPTPRRTSSVDVRVRRVSPADTQSVDLELPPPREKTPSVLSRLAAALRRTTPVLNIPAWVLVGGVVLGVPAGYLLSRLLPGEGTASVPPEGRPVGAMAATAAPTIAPAPTGIGALEPLAERRRNLELSASVRLEMGDVEGAYWELVEAARIDPESRRVLQQLRQAEAGLQLERQSWQAEVDENLAAAQRSLDDGRIRDALAFANRALDLDPMSLPAPELIVASEAAAARIRARRESAPPPAPEPVETAAPVVEPQPEPPAPVVAAEPAAPVATTGTLVVAVSTLRSPGVITLYLGEEQILRERFKFVVEKKGLLKSLPGKGIGGQLRRELIRDPGNLELRLYVSMPGEPTQSLPLAGRLDAGDTLSLVIDIGADGKASARLE